jgi:hypothetical protein
MKKFAIAAVALLILTPAAWAGAYVGASVGQTDVSVSGIDDDDTSWKLVGGYTFMKFLGIEGSYRNFGGISATAGTLVVETDASSIDVFGVGTYKLGKVDVFGKLGYSRIELDATFDDTSNPGPITVSDSETELAYGAGVMFGIGKANIRIEYEIFDTTEDLNMVSAGAVFKF